MKKLFTILLLAAITLSCSKSSDDNTEKAVAMTMVNLAGRYQITSLVTTNGLVVPFKGFCATKNDVLVVKPFNKVYIEKYYGNCGDWVNYSVAQDFVLDGSGALLQNGAGNGYFFGTVTELTATKFRINFIDPTQIPDQLSDPVPFQNYKSVLYTRI